MKWSVETAPGAAPVPCAGGLPAGTRRARLVDRPTVTVDQLLLEDGREAAVKRYFFPSAGARLRGLLRHTGLGTPKPVREARSLLRLQAAGVPVAPPYAWAVGRGALGVVHDGWLATGWLAGRSTLEALLCAGTAPALPVWEEIGASVRRIHDAGCWYRNLASRNLLLTAGERPEFAWIDPAKSRWQGGAVHEVHALSDLLLFLEPVEPLLPAGALQAFCTGHGRWPGVQAVRELRALLPGVARSPVEAAVQREKKRLAAGTAR